MQRYYSGFYCLLLTNLLHVSVARPSSYRKITLLTTFPIIRRSVWIYTINLLFTGRFHISRAEHQKFFQRVDVC
jgi:hypothetical protein